jgi:hypothetical protein
MNPISKIVSALVKEVTGQINVILSTLPGACCTPALVVR